MVLAALAPVLRRAEGLPPSDTVHAAGSLLALLRFATLHSSWQPASAIHERAVGMGDPPAAWVHEQVWRSPQGAGGGQHWVVQHWAPRGGGSTMGSATLGATGRGSTMGRAALGATRRGTLALGGAPEVPRQGKRGGLRDGEGGCVGCDGGNGDGGNGDKGIVLA